MEIIGKITGIARRLNSRSGNPRWTVWIDGVPYATGNDSQVAYRLSESWANQKVKARISGSSLVEAELVPSGNGA